MGPLNHYTENTPRLAPRWVALSAHVETLTVPLAMNTLLVLLFSAVSLPSLQAHDNRTDAAPLLREALQASRETLGKRHPTTLTSINNLGMLLKEQGDLVRAAPLLRKALQARRGSLGNWHPDTATSMNNIGALLVLQGDLAGAAPLYSEALQVRR